MAIDALTADELSKLNILVVEDNQNMRTLMTTIMRMLGVDNVQFANSGVDGLSALRGASKIPDIAFIDMRMEPGDGLTLTRQIRSGEGFGSATAGDDASDRKVPRNAAISTMPVIIFSAYSEMQRVMAARDAGANDFLAKPLSPRAVLEHMTMVLRHPGDFIEAEAYRGPDRRRDRPFDYDGEDRRGGRAGDAGGE
jgi:two-component system chemotaxis response regulator CheY